MITESCDLGYHEACGGGVQVERPHSTYFGRFLRCLCECHRKVRDAATGH